MVAEASAVVSVLVDVKLTGVKVRLDEALVPAWGLQEEEAVKPSPKSYSPGVQVHSKSVSLSR